MAIMPSVASMASLDDKARTCSPSEQDKCHGHDMREKCKNAQMPRSQNVNMEILIAVILLTLILDPDHGDLDSRS